MNPYAVYVVHGNNCPLSLGHHGECFFQKLVCHNRILGRLFGSADVIEGFAVTLIKTFIFFGKDFAIMGQSVLTLDQQANPPIGVCEKVLGKLGLLISSEIDIAAAVIHTEHRASSLGLVKGKSVLVHGEFCAALQFTADNKGRIAGTKPSGSW